MCRHSLTITLEIKKEVQGRMARMIDSLHIAGEKNEEKKISLEIFSEGKKKIT